MKLTATDTDTDLTKINITGGTRSDLPTQSKNVIAWTNDGTTTLEMLPNGEYTLEETTTPDGYLTVSKFDFTITDGVVSSIDGTFTDGDAVILDDGKTIRVRDA